MKYYIEVNERKEIYSLNPESGMKCLNFIELLDIDYEMNELKNEDFINLFLVLAKQSKLTFCNYKYYIEVGFLFLLYKVVT